MTWSRSFGQLVPFGPMSIQMTNDKRFSDLTVSNNMWCHVNKSQSNTTLDLVPVRDLKLFKYLCKVHFVTQLIWTIISIQPTKEETKAIWLCHTTCEVILTKPMKSLPSSFSLTWTTNLLKWPSKVHLVNSFLSCQKAFKWQMRNSKPILTVP